MQSPSQQEQRIEQQDWVILPNDLTLDNATKPQLLAKAIQENKGRELVLDKLWQARREVAKKCSLEELKRALGSPCMYTFPDGLRLLAYFVIRKIGIRPAGFHIKKMLLEDHVMKADQELQMHIEEALIRDFAHTAVHVNEDIAAKYEHVMGAISKHSYTDKDKYDAMISRCLYSVIWRSIEAKNQLIQYRAFSLFLDFFSLIDHKKMTRAPRLQRHHDWMKQMMLHDFVPIRIIAADKIPKLISLYHSSIPKQVIDDILATLTHKLSRDIVAEVRHAVVEGLYHVLPESALMSENMTILKHIIPYAVSDGHVPVRIAAYRRLREMQDYKFFNVNEILDISEITMALEHETNDSVRIEIIKYILKNYFNNDKGIDCLNKLIETGRIAALTFYQMIFRFELISVVDAANHIKAMTRILDQTIEISCDVVKNKTIIECILLLWMSMKQALGSLEHAQIETEMDAQIINLYKSLFRCCQDNNSPIAEITLLLGSLLPEPHRDGHPHIIINVLRGRIDDRILDSYGEATSMLNIEYLLETTSTGLSDLQNCVKDTVMSTSLIGNKDTLTPTDRLNQALYYLKYIAKYASPKGLVFFSAVRLDDLYKKLTSLREVIEARLERVSDVTIPDDLIVQALEIKPFLANAVVLKSIERTYEEDLATKDRYRKEVCDELAWFANNIVLRMNLVARDNRMRFLTKICQALLKNVSIMMNFKWLTGDSDEYKEDEDDKKSEKDKDPLFNCFHESVASLLISYCEGLAPLVCVSHVINITKVLLKDGPNFIARWESTKYVVAYISKWIIGRFGAGDVDINVEEVAASLCDLWEYVREMSISNPKYRLKMLPLTYVIWQVGDMIKLLTDHLSEISKQTKSFGDPRSKDYKVTYPIRIILIGTIFNINIRFFLYNVRTCLGKHYLFRNNEDNDCIVSIDEQLIRLASIAQIVYLWKNDLNEKKKIDNDPDYIEYDGEVLEMLDEIRERMEEIVIGPSDSHIIRDQLVKLLSH